MTIPAVSHKLVLKIFSSSHSTLGSISQQIDFRGRIFLTIRNIIGSVNSAQHDSMKELTPYRISESNGRSKGDIIINDKYGLGNRVHYSPNGFQTLLNPNPWKSFTLRVANSVTP